MARLNVNASVLFAQQQQQLSES